MSYYRTSQVAKILNVSSGHIRRLCESGLIESELSTGGQWRIGLAEVDRLRAEGVPPAPSKEPEAETPADARTNQAQPNAKLSEGLPPNDETGRAIREALASVQIATARLERRKIELAGEEIEDQFRARDTAQAAELQRVRAEQDRQRAATARIEWRNYWLKYAQDRVPRDASPGLRLHVNDAVAGVLDTRLSVNDATVVVTRLVDAAVAIALEPYHRECRKREIIDMAIRDLPSDFYWHLRRGETLMDDAKQTAREAIESIGPAATDAQMKGAAKGALQPLVVAFQHNAAKQALIDKMRYWRWLVDARPTDEERAAALAALANALDQCATGTPLAAMEKIKDQILAGFDKQVEERVSQERKGRDAGATDRPRA